MKELLTETIEHAALYNKIYNDDSITVTLRKYYDSYEVVYETPERYYVLGQDCEWCFEHAFNVYNEYVAEAKKNAADIAEAKKIPNR